MSFKNQVRRALGDRYVSVTACPFGVDKPTEAAYENLIRSCTDNFYGRTRLSLDRIEFALSPDDATEEWGKDRNLTIALVSSGLNGPRDYRKLDEYAKKESKGKRTPKNWEINFSEGINRERRIIQRTNKFDVKKWVDRRISELEKALLHDPDIICFPEFAFLPPDIERLPTGYEDRTRYGRNFLDFENKISKIVSDAHEGRTISKRPFLFMGTYHCPIDYYNLGVIYPLGGTQSPMNVDYIFQGLDKSKEKKRDIAKSPIFHRKRFPARRANERSRIPSEIGFYSYRVNGIHIGVMICSDIIDLNQFLNMVRLNSVRSSRDPMDIILIPAYNTNDMLRSMCRELSFMCSNIVAYVNANPLFPEFPKSELYCCGYDSEELSKLNFTNPSPIHAKNVFDVNRKRSSVSIISFNGPSLNNLRAHFRNLDARFHGSTRAHWGTVGLA